MVRKRMHLTLKNEAIKLAAENFLAQQARFDDFIEYYNQERPHRAVNPFKCVTYVIGGECQGSCRIV